MGHVVVTGGSGYIGTRLIAQLVAQGHRVQAVVRAASASKLPRGCEAVPGNALDASTIAGAITPETTLVQLLGTPHPSPAKAPLFRSVDLVSAHASISAAREKSIAHFVYVSVAHPAPVMHAYIAARMEAEAALRASGVPATVLRPWYVLGPGHYWPHALRPLYAVAELVPSMREGARRLGLVSVRQMVAALAWAVGHPPARAGQPAYRVLEVPDIRKGVGTH